MTANTKTNFEKHINKLNDKQRLAVETIYGPVMVIAGPGTGKTQILAVRIANLLESEAQVNPSEILCITFTDAGRIAMKQRLNDICGVDIAQRIAIHTFHSFCNEILQTNTHYFDKDILEQASELEQYTIIKKMLDNLPQGHLFKNPKNPYEKAKDLLSLFGKMKQENWTKHLLDEKIDEYVNEIMPLDEELLYKIGDKKGTKKPDYIDEELRMQKTKIAIDLYDTYIQMMLDASRYDFNDMIQWVVKALENNDDLRLRYAEQFQYILVDEYQDSNGSQNKLIHLLCCDTDNPNLFVVGDDDQSIYRFQGANMENMESIKHKYSNIKIIELEQNYRSYEEILNAAENFISKNPKRLKEKNKPLSAAKGLGHDAPHLIGLQNARQENIYLAIEIKKLIDKKILPKEIAVLFSTNEECLKFSEYLQFLNIPFYTKSTTNLLNMPFSKSIFDIMRYVQAECDTPFSGDLMLFQILHFQYFGLDALDIAKINFQSNKAAKSKDTLSGSLREYLQDWSNRTNTSLFANEPNQKLLSTFNTLQSFIKDAMSNNLFPFFRNVIKQCGVYEYIMQQPNKIDLLDELTALFSFVETEAHLNPEMNLTDFMRLIDIMQQNELKVSYNKTLGKDNGVQLLTMHKSKGLEFDYVFVAACIAKKWEAKINRGSNIKIPMNVFDEQFKILINDKNSIKQKLKDQDIAEMRRLMYVAATRAKKQLTFSFYRKDAADKEVAASQFLVEFFTQENALANAINDEAVTTEMMIQFEPVQLTSLTPPNIKLIEKEYIEDQLKNFSLSVSALNNFMKCPLHFYFVNILKVPSGLNENASFGSAVHTALEYAYTELKNNNNEFPAVDDFIKIFKKDMFKRRETFTSDGYKNKLEYGVEILKNFYDDKIIGTNKIVKLEHNTNVSWNGIPLKGFMDKLEFVGNNVNIVDYKTGKFDGGYAKDGMKEPFNKKGEKTSDGGGYWRQGAFYNLMLSIDKKNDWKPVSSEFVFVEPVKPTNEYKTKKYIISEQDIELLKEQILDSWEKINRHEFYTGCNDASCDWCNFVKDNKLESNLEEVK